MSEENVEPTETVAPVVEPIEPVEPSEPVVEPTEPIEPSEPVDTDPAKPKQTAQERINEITSKYRGEERLKTEAQREVEYWKNLAISGNEPTPKPIVKSNRPSQSSYETVEEYEDALMGWHDQKKEAVNLENAQKDNVKKSISRFNENAAKLRKEHDDFDEVVESPVFTDSMRSALFASENGPMVAYHLGTNREIADKIKVLPPEMQIYEMGKLETQLLLAQQTKTTTSAPDPIKPVGSTAVSEVDDSKLTTKQWMEREKERDLAKLTVKIGG